MTIIDDFKQWGEIVVHQSNLAMTLWRLFEELKITEFEVSIDGIDTFRIRKGRSL